MNPPLTRDQSQILRDHVQADPALAAAAAQGDDVTIANALNALAAPDYFVWRTNVTEAEYTSTTGIDVANNNATTTWSWTAFIARSVGEQNGWERMFSQGWINPSLPTVRQGIADIFSGTANNAGAQRTHMTTVSKRRATRIEKLFAVGPGTFSPTSTMATEGPISYSEVSQALRPTASATNPVGR